MDHGARKRLINPARGFKTLPTASATIKGFECEGARTDGRSSAAGGMTGAISPKHPRHKGSCRDLRIPDGVRFPES